MAQHRLQVQGITREALEVCSVGLLVPEAQQMVTLLGLTQVEQEVRLH